VVGHVLREGEVVVRRGRHRLLAVSVADLTEAFKRPLDLDGTLVAREP
jgi:hypothetical protein